MSKFFSKIWGFIKKHKKLIIILLIVVIVGGVIISKVKSSSSATDVEQATLTTSVEKMDLQSSISVTGTLEAGDTASVTSTLSGVKVSTVNYEVGDYVEAGTVVVEFDGDDLEDTISDLDLDSEISTMETEHNLQDLLDQIADIQEEIEEDADVYNNLVELKALYEKYPDDETIATRYATENAAVGGIDAYIKNYESLSDSLADAQYNYQLALLNQQKSNNQTEDSYESAYEQIDNTQVTAPISGYITAINVEEGNNYTQGSTIFTISDTSSFVVEATVDEYDISSLEKGMSCVVKFDATDDDEFAGELTYVAVSTSASTSSSSSSSYSSSSSSSSGYEIKITLTDTDERLRAGMTAKASVILDSVSDVLAVAYDCVETDSDGNSYVTVVDDNGNETKVEVTVGMESDYYIEISGDGIEEGTKVKATASSSSSSSDDSSMMMMDMGGGQGGGGDMGGGPGGGF